MTWRVAWSRSNSQHKTHVGAGLLAKAVYQSVHLALTHRLREQARSHIFDRVEPLKGERQLNRDLLALRQTALELSWVMNQHVLPGERLSRDQP